LSGDVSTEDFRGGEGVRHTFGMGRWEGLEEHFSKRIRRHEDKVMIL